MNEMAQVVLFLQSMGPNPLQWAMMHYHVKPTQIGKTADILGSTSCPYHFDEFHIVNPVIGFG